MAAPTKPKDTSNIDIANPDIDRNAQAPSEPNADLSTSGQPMSPSTGTPLHTPSEQDAIAQRSTSGVAPGTASNGLKEMIVLTDGFHYVQRDPKNPKDVLSQELARRGDKVLVTQADAKRLAGIGALGDEESLKAAQADAAAADSGLATQAQLETMTPLQLLVYMGSHGTDEVDRVEELENSRETPNEDVIKAINAVRELQAG